MVDVKIIFSTINHTLLHRFYDLLMNKLFASGGCECFLKQEDITKSQHYQ